MTLLALAARFALRGRAGLLRSALIAAAAGAAVALLLLAVSVPGALAARDDRSAALNPRPAEQVTEASLLWGEVRVSTADDSVNGAVASPLGAHPTLPPGVERLPPDGDMVVSPALHRLLGSPDGALVRARLPYRVVGTIGSAGLIGPTDLRFLARDDRIERSSSAVSLVNSFGLPNSPFRLDPVLALLVVVGVLILLLPVGVVVAIAGRFGAEQRDERLAALRLLGLSTAQTLQVALAEATIAGLLGDAVGLVLFAGARQSLGLFSIASLSVFPGDAVPPVPLAALVLLLVPAVILAAAFAGLRGIRVEPMSVVRRGRVRPRRLWWRLVPLLVAAPLLLGAVGSFSSASGGDVPRVAVGVALLLLGALAVLPWATERLARLARGGAVSWQFATRRISSGRSTTARVVGAIAIALAGTIALQMLFTGLASRYTDSADAPGRTGTLVQSSELPGTRAAVLREQLVGFDVDATTSVDAVTTGSHRFESTIVLGSCAALRRLSTLPSCASGSVFQAGGDTRLAGRTLQFGGGAATWRLPSRTVRVPRATDVNGYPLDVVILATDDALPVAQAKQARMSAFFPAGSPVASAVGGLVALDPLLSVDPVRAVSTSHQFDSVQRGLTIGLVLVMLLIGGVLLVSIGDQLRERQRVLAVLAAVGMRRATMVRSILFESAVPIAVGAALASVAGIALGWVLLRVMSVPFALSPSSLAVSVVTAIVVPLAVTSLSLPAATRLMRPEGLRTE